jgi:hypothetical protein
MVGGVMGIEIFFARSLDAIDEMATVHLTGARLIPQVPFTPSDCTDRSTCLGRKYPNGGEAELRRKFLTSCQGEENLPGLTHARALGWCRLERG